MILSLSPAISKFSGASRNDPFSLCKKLGISLMAEEIGLKAWEFGENLHDLYQKVDVRKNEKETLALAQEYVEKSPRLTGKFDYF